MTWYIDPETGDVFDHTGSKVGTASGPPYTIPDDVREVLWNEYFPADHSSVSVDDLKAVLDVAGGDMEWGTP